MFAKHSYASKSQLLTWASDLLKMDISSLDDLMNGAIWIQLLDAYYPELVPMQRVDFFAYTYEQSMPNYKTLQLAFDRIDIRRDVDIRKLLVGHQGSLLELLQWICKFLSGKVPAKHYDATARRSLSKHGGCNQIPRYGVSKEAFRRWRMQEANVVYNGGAYQPQARNITRDSAAGKPQPPRMVPQVPRASKEGQPPPPVSPIGQNKKRIVQPSKRAPIGDLANPLAVAGEACALVKSSTATLAKLVKELAAGDLNFCIARGCLRSLQDVLVTLIRHTSLLLKDTVLRLDFWSDIQDNEWRIRIERHLRTLNTCEDALGTVLAALKTAEGSLEAPGTGIAGQPHETVDSIARTAQDLNNVLHRVDQAQAELPTIRDPAEMPTQHELARVRLPDVDKATAEELSASRPEFLSTTTSHACKIGAFQFRRLRNGDIYKGRYARSKKCGDGCYSFMNGDIYEGEFQDDHMQGHGVYMFAGQGRYEGGWRVARYNGFGTETFAKGSTYAGQYVEGSRAGHGVCRYFNGDYYEGQWAEGVRNGSGMQQCMDGSNYVGQYKDAKRDGCGVYTFHNGDCYLGTYEADLPNGIGVYLFEKGQKYMGEWSNGKKHGLCEYIVESGERYVGEWEEGKPKWVQSLGEEGDEELDLSEDMQSKVTRALEVATQSREAAERSQSLATAHWDAGADAQQQIQAAVEQADLAAAKAQQGRHRAMVLSHKLDVLVQKHVGDAGWPLSDDEDK